MLKKRRRTVRNIFVLSIICLLCVTNVYAQLANPIVVTGVVTDNTGDAELSDVSIRVFQDSALVAHGITTNTNQITDRNSGIVFSAKVGQTAYNITIPNPGMYTFEFAKKGYVTERLQYTIPEFHSGKNVKRWRMPTVSLQNEGRERYVDTAIVKASKVLMVYRGDTIVYNADAIELSESSMLERLMEKLPGIELRNSQLFVNGQYVRRLLIDGSELFHGNSAVALKNLPAYTVERVKVYGMEKDGAYLLTDAERRIAENRELVVDVRLKREYAYGWIANAEAGYGLPKNRYLCRAFGLLFNTSSRLVSFINLNNLNNESGTDTSGKWSEKQWFAGDLPQGLKKHIYGGTELSRSKGSGKTSYYANLSFHNTCTDIFEESSTTSFLSESDVYGRMRRTVASSNWEIKYNSEVKIPMKRLFLSNKTTISYTRNKSDGTTLSAQFNMLPIEDQRGCCLDSLFNYVPSKQLYDATVYRLFELFQGHYNQLRAQTEIGGRYRIGSSAHRLDFNLQARGSRTNSYNFSDYNLFYRGGSDYRLRYTSTPENNYSLQGTLSYKLPLRPTSSFSLSIELKSDKTYNSGIRNAYRFDRLPEDGIPTFGTLPSMSGWKELSIDQTGLYNSGKHSFNTRLSSTTLYTFSQKRYITFGIATSYSRRTLKDTRLVSTSGRISKSYVFVHPSIAIQMDSWNFSYRMGNVIPDISLAGSIQDTYNPLLIQEGNPKLKTTQQHLLACSYRGTIKKTSVMSYLFYELFRHSVAMDRYYNKEIGSLRYCPHNIEGNWRSGIENNIIFPISAKNTLDFRHATYYHHSVDYVDGSRSRVNNISSSFNLSYTMRPLKKTHIKVSGGVDWNHADSKRPRFHTRNSFDVNYGLSLNTILPLEFHINTSLRMNSRYGYDDHSMNDNILLWNVSLDRSIGKSLSIKAEMSDILNQVNSVRRVLNSQGIVETWTNTLPRFFMIQLVYRFNKSPKVQ